MSAPHRASNGALDDYQAHALEVAGGLVRAGVPVFVASADPGAPTGYRLPLEWQRTDTTRSLRALALWRPGMALCAVMGHTLDLIDFDPRNGNGQLGGGFTEWPTAYASASTPSGGSHVFVAALRVGSRDGILPGVDIKGGRPDGAGRGFAFIAPTVRASKVDGSQRAYEWMSEPDPESVAALASLDHSGAALAALIEGARAPARPRWDQPSREVDLLRPPARTFTAEAAWRYVWPFLDRLSRAVDGQRNALLNDAAKVLSHFGPEFWSYEQAVGWLLGALPAKDHGVRRWDPMQTIESAYRSAGGDWRAERVEAARFPAALQQPAAVEVRTRVVSIAEHLHGTYEALAPSRGAVRDDAAHTLYGGKWHTVVGGTGAGKSWLALLHAREEILAGRTVAYAHFEEASPAETAARLRSLSNDPGWLRAVVERFVWLDCGDLWAEGEFGYVLATLDPYPSLVVLDGINAACTKHGQDPAQVQAVGWYRSWFVTPAARNGAAVLSLGHPPKARDRQDERHGYGSTGWLDEVDGVGFRLRAHHAHPIRRGATGSALLYSAKDRPGGVETLGQPDHNREGWVYLGSLVVDNATDPEGGTSARLTAPKAGDVEGSSDPIESLAEAIEEVLALRPDRSYARQADLVIELRERGVKFKTGDVGPALLRMEKLGRLQRDPAPERLGAAWGGTLVSQTTDHEDE